MKNRFTCVVFKSGKWWIGFAEEIHGAVTQGRTLKELRENLREVITMMIEHNREKAARDAG